MSKELTEEFENLLKAYSGDPTELLEFFSQRESKNLTCLLPVTLPEEEMYGFDPSIKKPGKTITPEEEKRATIHKLNAGAEVYWLPVFTSKGERDQGEACSVSKKKWSDILDMLSSDYNCMGIVFNPWTSRVFLTKNILRIVARSLK